MSGRAVRRKAFRIDAIGNHVDASASDGLALQVRGDFARDGDQCGRSREDALGDAFGAGTVHQSAMFGLFFDQGGVHLQ